MKKLLIKWLPSLAEFSCEGAGDGARPHALRGGSVSGVRHDGVFDPSAG